jgi:hypothetical protein
MEDKAELWEKDINKLQKLSKENEEMALKIHWLEKKISHKKEIDQKIKKEWQQ